MIQTVRDVFEALGVDVAKVKMRRGEVASLTDVLEWECDWRLPEHDDYDQRGLHIDPLDYRDGDGNPIYITAAEHHDIMTKYKREMAIAVAAAMGRTAKILTVPLAASVEVLLDEFADVQDSLVSGDMKAAQYTMENAGLLARPIYEALTILNLYSPTPDDDDVTDDDEDDDEE